MKWKDGFESSPISRIRVSRTDRVSRTGAKLGLLLTYKYWMALTHTKLKLNKHESKTL